MHTAYVCRTIRRVGCCVLFSVFCYSFLYLRSNSYFFIQFFISTKFKTKYRNVYLGLRQFNTPIWKNRTEILQLCEKDVCFFITWTCIIIFIKKYSTHSCISLTQCSVFLCDLFFFFCHYFDSFLLSCYHISESLCLRSGKILNIAKHTLLCSFAFSPHMRLSIWAFRFLGLRLPLYIHFKYSNILTTTKKYYRYWFCLFFICRWKKKTCKNVFYCGDHRNKCFFLYLLLLDNDK